MKTGQNAPKKRKTSVAIVAPVVPLSARHDALLGTTTDASIKVEAPSMFLYEVHKVPQVVLGESALHKGSEELQLDAYLRKEYGRNRAYSSRPEVREFLKAHAKR